MNIPAFLIIMIVCIFVIARCDVQRATQQHQDEANQKVSSPEEQTCSNSSSS